MMLDLRIISQILHKKETQATRINKYIELQTMQNVCALKVCYLEMKKSIHRLEENVSKSCI